MASHGVARSTRTARTEEQRLQDINKINKYRELEDSIRSHVARDAYDSTLFQLTSKLLRLNPEYYTIWNVRRCCLTSGLSSRPSDGSSPSRVSPNTSQSATTKPSSDDSSPSSSGVIPLDPRSPTTGKNGTTVDPDPAKGAVGGVGVVAPGGNNNVESDMNTLQSELAFTIPLLLEFPKCYWIWKYRKWILEQVILRLPAPAARRIWEAELALDSKMLTKDRRNFHAWGYRRHVVARLESPILGGESLVEDEFAYTTKMIHADLSNFSAWHNRSLLILQVLDERGADGKTRSAFLDDELTLVRDALNVGPEDQSLWYYHQFLMSQIIDHVGRPTIAPTLTVEDRVAYVTRELEDIKDLLEDYDNTKWIYQVLIEYTWALRRLEQSAEDRVPEDDQTVKDDLRGWLEKLRTLDPMRAGRWDDITRQLSQSRK